MDDPVDIWFERQRLRQRGDMDCGVSVFAELAGLSREEVLLDWPEAVNGVTPEQAVRYLISKGFAAKICEPDGVYCLPCAHLVASGNGYHWIYQAENGGIHDPSPVFEHTPPRTIKLATHYQATIMTVAIEKGDSPQ